MYVRSRTDMDQPWAFLSSVATVWQRTVYIEGHRYGDQVLQDFQARTFAGSASDVNVSDLDGSQSSKPGLGKRVVVVDDNPDICAFVSSALKGAGYEVETAADGGEALALMSHRQAHLLITDLFMPGVEGFETITRCRAAFPQTTVMVISAGKVPGMKHDFLATAVLLGIAVTLRKPFQTDKLLDTVQQALQPR
jgi:CheY-like chemotaxis protein